MILMIMRIITRVKRTNNSTSNNNDDSNDNWQRCRRGRASAFKKRERFRELCTENTGSQTMRILEQKQTTVDFRNFIVFFWAETLAH